MRRPWRTTAGGWHTETNDPHAHHHHESSDRLFFSIFYEAVAHDTHVIDFCRIGRVAYPSWRGAMGNDPLQFSIFRHGRGSCAATCGTVREAVAIIDICMVVFGSIALFSLHARGSSL